MSAVLKGHNSNLRCDVAVKLLPETQCDEADRARRFV
jgi:hypothetical protein